jgi:hypothetical protein
MEAVGPCSSRTLVSIYKSTRPYNLRTNIDEWKSCCNDKLGSGRDLLQVQIQHLPGEDEGNSQGNRPSVWDSSPRRQVTKQERNTTSLGSSLGLEPPPSGYEAGAQHRVPRVQFGTRAPAVRLRSRTATPRPSDSIDLHSDSVSCRQLLLSKPTKKQTNVNRDNTLEDHGWNPGRGRHFSFRHICPDWILGALSLRVKQPEREMYHMLESNAEI